MTSRDVYRAEDRRIAVVKRAARDSTGIGIMGAVALAIVGIILWSVFTNGATSGPEPGATIREITLAPQAYVGQTVTVSGEINEVMSASAFSIGEGGFSGDDVLVVGAEADTLANVAALEGQAALVTGTVRLFEYAPLTAEIGYDLDSGLFADRTGRPVLIASEVVPLGD